MDKSAPIFHWDSKEFYNLVETCKLNPSTPYILDYLDKSGPILEAGCGMGHFVKFLSDNNYNIEGVEINDNAVKTCNELEPNLRVFYGDVENLKYSNDYFTGIISLGVVEHFINGPDKPLHEMFRVLKPGGKAIISVPCFNYLRIIKKYTGLNYLDYYLRIFYHLFKKGSEWLYKNNNKEKINYKYNRWPIKGDFFEYRFTKNEFNKKLNQAGFRIIKEVPLDYIGGLYHELGGIFVNIKKPNLFIKIINKLFLKIPFFHNHFYLTVVTK